MELGKTADPSSADGTKEDSDATTSSMLSETGDDARSASRAR